MRQIEAVRPLITTLALALCLLGCTSEPPLPSDGVRLLTGGSMGACYLMGPRGELVADPNVGTTFLGAPVIWPPGYAGRRVGAQVEVRNPGGMVVATTGKWYEIPQVMQPGGEPRVNVATYITPVDP